MDGNVHVFICACGYRIMLPSDRYRSLLPVEAPAPWLITCDLVDGGGHSCVLFTSTPAHNHRLSHGAIVGIANP